MLIDFEKLRPMKIVFLTTHFPSPPNYGAAKRVYHLCSILGEIGKVTLIVLKSFDYVEQDRLIQTRKDFSSVKLFIADSAPPMSLRGKFERLIDLKKVGNRHFSLSDKSREELVALINGCDVVWCHTLMAADMGGIFNYGRSVIDLDDLISDKLSLQAQEKKGVVKWQKCWQSLLWRRWEKDSLRRFCAIAVCSEQDKTKMENRIQDKTKIKHRLNVFVLPNGFESPKRPFLFKKHSQKVIGFVGILRYTPNAEGVEWFIKEVFPILLKSEPTVRLRVAGRLPVEGLGIDHPQIDLLDFVEDLDSEMQNWDAMIVPLKVGGGTRLKILEAFSKQVPVISTHLGAYGIKAEHGRHFMLADDPVTFSDFCLQILRDRNLAEELTCNAYQLFQTNYTWSNVRNEVDKIIEFVESCAK